VTRHLVLACLTAVAVWAGTGCRSAGPIDPPVAMAAPAPVVAPVAPTEPAPLPTVRPTEEPAGPPPEMPREADPASDEAPETEAAGPEAIQKEALDLCQSASEYLARGERERAVALVDQAYERMLVLPKNGDDAFLQAREDIRQLIATLLSDAYRKNLASPPPSLDLGLPIVDNEHVRREIKSFTTVERELFVEAYQRSGLFRPMILAKLEAAHLPSQLSWLPMVESWFKVRAYSRAGAVGLWQFIASTGLRYGMSRDGWVDERMDPEKATDAAIGYLTDLHAMFGDWPKALAAYNCGEARVARLQGRSKDEFRDFWDLYEQLPGETRRYLPRLMAALVIIENPERYGMTLPEATPASANLARVKTERAVSVTDLEKALGLATESLRDLNPELRHGGTPPRAYELRVPLELAERAGVALAALPEWTPPRPTYVTHRVRSGQTLGSIAAQYGTTAKAIQEQNGLRSAHRLRVGQRLRVPLPGSRR
jgi:membrane-bound lytic murein transglycosylase D